MLKILDLNNKIFTNTRMIVEQAVKIQFQPNKIEQLRERFFEEAYADI